MGLREPDRRPDPLWRCAMDVHDAKQRSFNMSRIRSRDTKPETIVRRLAFALGLRYRLYRKDLPGKPDLVFAGRKKVVFVHGCYWHRHDCRYGRVVPKTNAEFWQIKRQSNVDRDVRNVAALTALGWQTLIIWECETRDGASVSRRLGEFLPGATKNPSAGVEKAVDE